MDVLHRDKKGKRGGDSKKGLLRAGSKESDRKLISSHMRASILYTDNPNDALNQSHFDNAT